MSSPSDDPQVEWTRIRQSKFTTYPAPSDWPAGVRPISLAGSGLFGIDGKGEIYWDGHRLITEKRLSNFERALAIIALVLTAIGVGATVVQAYAALAAIVPK